MAENEDNQAKKGCTHELSPRDPKDHKYQTHFVELLRLTVNSYARGAGKVWKMVKLLVPGGWRGRIIDIYWMIVMC